MILRAADLSSILTPINHRNQEVSDIKFSPSKLFRSSRSFVLHFSLQMIGIWPLGHTTTSWISTAWKPRNVCFIARRVSRVFFSLGLGVGICKANSSYITHIDWDSQSQFPRFDSIRFLLQANLLGKLIMTNSGAREQLFYEAPRGTRITSIKTTDIEKMKWFTWSGVLGLVCEGIWPAGSDITDVNSTHLTRDERTLATGDDFGLVKLFDFPAKVIDRRLFFSSSTSLNVRRAKPLNTNGTSVTVPMSRVFDGLVMMPIWSPSVVEMWPRWFGNTIATKMCPSLPTTTIMFSLERRRRASLQILTAARQRRPLPFDVTEAKVMIRITPIPKKKVTIPMFNMTEIWIITNDS